MAIRVLVMAPILACAGLGIAGPSLADANADAQAETHAAYAASLRAWERHAAEGDAEAQFRLGQAYAFGEGVPQDLNKAEELFGKAAAQGHVEAADSYGILRYQRGDHAGALTYLIDATTRGDARAQYLLGMSNFKGDAVPQDWIRAYALLILAQQAGLPQAEPVIAQMDEIIPLYERQKGQELASQLGAEIEIGRARRLASADPASDAPPADPLARRDHPVAPPGTQGLAALPAEQTPATVATTPEVAVAVQAPAPSPAVPVDAPVAEVAEATAATVVPLAEVAQIMEAPAADAVQTAEATVPPVAEVPQFTEVAAPPPPVAVPPAAPAAEVAQAAEPAVVPAAEVVQLEVVAEAPESDLAQAAEPVVAPQPEAPQTAEATTAPETELAQTAEAITPTVSVAAPSAEVVAVMPAEDTAPPSGARGPWRLQFGAFGVPGNADALWNRLKKRPEVAGYERIDAGSGRVKRLLAGGYATAAEAKSACSGLTAAGFTCLVTRN